MQHSPTDEQAAIIHAARLTRRQRIIELLWYDPDSGIFRWRDASRQKKDTAGSWGTDGYLRIMVDYKMYSAAPLGWFLYHREWPLLMVDHKDRNPRNNRIWNFRLSNHSLNAFNSYLRIDNKTGCKGVQQDKRTGRWYAKLGHEHLGTFKFYEDAVAARMEAENAYTNS